MDGESTSREIEVLRSALAGDQTGLGGLLESYRDRLRRMIGLRLDRRLQGRVDPSDVIQEAYIDVTNQLPQFVENPKIPFFLWVRFITGRKLHRFHKRHLQAHKRDPRREVPLPGRSMPEASSILLAEALVDKGLSPSQEFSRKEEKQRLEDILLRMKPADREVLALRHYEQLTNAEVAQVLGITESAAKVRYVRAARRLKDAFPGSEETSDD